ncbi:hypothetical protein LPW11_20185 [Geomonas sp. RF6]|uniref:hypothetical protein n=1 Tax=Geomonas sp. RF6 TaxID=2897342 RepID=UPI001E32B457|nr:hypothetical protein [Geomonas sp. RF6]UFS70180.1 hypothetical protein LPW11_20185 [Geomonas sp. RF6]
MGRFLCNVMLLFVVLCALAGCGGGGGGASSSSSSSGVITGVAWSFENESPDLSGNVATCYLNVQVKCSPSIAASDIANWAVTAPTGWGWRISGANSAKGITSNGTPYIAAGMWYGADINAFPLAGNWKVTIVLANGEVSSYDFVMQEPGSTANATHDFLYTPEDSTPFFPAQYIAALKRFPAEGCTFNFTGNSVVSSGFASAAASYLAAEPRAYNLYLWLYDGNFSYVGYSQPVYSLTDHSASALMTPDGEISLTPASVTTSTGAVDLSQVRYVRVIAVDGGQFPLSGALLFHYRSISAPVPVAAPLT